MTQLSDELLLAYLDGQLDRTQAIGIADLAEYNPEISRRLLRLKRTQSHLMETFAAIRMDERAVPPELSFPDAAPKVQISQPAANDALPPPMPAAVAAPARAEGRSRSPLLVALALIVGAGAGFAGNAFITKPMAGPPKIEDRASQVAPTTPGWITDVAKFHAFFPKETLTPHPDAITNPELIRFQLTKVAGKPLTPPDLSRQGYELVRGQVFNYEPDRMMQLTYASKTEPPLAFYIVPGGQDSALAPAKHDDFRSFAWGEGQVRFLLAGQKNEDDLKVLATIAQSQMAKKS